MNTEYRNRIEALYLQMYRKLFAYAQSSMNNDALAEEAVQDTFVIACNKAEDVLNSPNPAGWLVNTLKNVIRNTKQSQETARRILSDYCSQNIQELTLYEDRPKLELLYGRLAEQKEFILLKEMAVDGRSYAEMAQDRNISIATCRKQVQRAKEYLQKKIKI